MSEELVPRDEARAALEARRELGPEYEDDLVEQFAARVEERLKGRRTPAGLDHNQKTAIVIISILASIPLILIASGAGLAGVIAICTALVAVNFLALRS